MSGPTELDLPETDPPALTEIDLESSDSDGDTADQTTGIAESQRLPARRKLQEACFKQWVSQQARAGLSGSGKARNTVEVSTEDQMSIRQLMAHTESKPIITGPREYQLELFERAKQQNTVAVLDTGTGKTLIAVLLLRHILDHELESRRLGHSPRISFFLVPSVNLVFQQCAVLECNLGQKIARFCGAMGTDLWTREVWSKHFAENMVIVCTAEVLHQCLAHAFITIEQINLLIFDEAHHAKLDHPYSKIIRDYYASVNTDMRPRIFGMTASPVDAKVDVVAAAEGLEQMLHSRIATTKDLTLLRKTVHRADEEVLRFTSFTNATTTPLYDQLYERFGTLDILDRLFRRAREISDHLGSWCSDFFWKLTLREAIASKGEARITREYNVDREIDRTQQLEEQISLFKQALAFVESQTLEAPTLAPPTISSKILRLIDYLQRHFERPSDMRCIVFVEQRHTARLLAKAFEYIGGANVRPGALVGAGGFGMSEINVSFKEQILTMMRFRNGQINCLFATSVAEEGLDVPDCNLVIRFDPCKTMIQYVQSRGRARHKHSKFVHMLENGNPDHEVMLRENRIAEQYMRNFCERLPTDRFLEGNDEGDNQIDADKNIFVVKGTGAKVTYANCLQILAHFCSSLPTEEPEALQPVYVIVPSLNKFVCEVILPACSPLPGTIGGEKRRKNLAKRSAAFKACVELYRRQFLDNNLLPIFQKRLPAMRNAVLALNMTRVDGYNMRTKPTIWQLGRGSVPTTLHLLLIDAPNGLDREHQPMVLLSRERLPELPDFPLYLSSGESSVVTTCSLPGTIQVSVDDVESLTTFTLRIFKDVFNKTFEHDSTKMSYWLVPASETSLSKPTNMRAVVDWKALEVVSLNAEYRWTPSMMPDFLVGKFIVDPFSGANRYFCKRIATEYKPSDPVPTDAVKKGRSDGSIMAYSVNMWKRSRQKVSWNADQPVMETEKVLLRRNMLAPPDKYDSEKATQFFLCPEPMRISSLGSGFVCSTLAFPAIIHRMESYLIAQELCQKLGVVLAPSLALEAVTKDSDSAEADDGQQKESVNFQEGMGSNYERLEFLGDCFLKMATSMSIFVRYPHDNEFESHVKRMVMLCNQNLCNVAKEMHLYEYIRSQSFSRRMWYPEGLKLLQGKGHTKQEVGVAKHRMGEKVIADVCEALIGGAFLTYDNPKQWTPESWTEAIKAVTMFVASEDHRMLKWSDYVDAYQTPEYQMQAATGSQLDLAQKVEKEHPYHFNHPRLLRSAFLHPSQPFIWEKVPSYQRLEFLGDSLLDVVCVTHLYHKYPDKDPGWLTEHKMAMTANKFLGALCVDIGFYKHLRHHDSNLTRPIQDYVTELEEAQRLAGAAVDSWTIVSDPPKCLADMVEAYVAAIFIDSGFDYSQVQRFFDMHMEKYFEDMTIYDTFAQGHPITRLHTLLDQSFGCHEYRLMTEEVVADDAITTEVIVGLIIHTTMVCGDVSRSVKYSKVMVATAAWDELHGMPAFEFRKKFGCTCSTWVGARETEGDSRLQEQTIE